MADMIDVLLASCHHGSGDGSSYDDTELRSQIAEIQAAIDECGSDIEAIQGVLTAHAADIDALKDAVGAHSTTLADLAQRLAEAETAVTGLEAATTDHETRIAALEANSGSGSGSDCDGECCVQHSILNGNGWEELEPDPEPSTWDLFIDSCVENYNEDLIGYQITDDGEAAHTFIIVDLATMTNAEDGKNYDCLVLQSKNAIGDSIPFDAPEAKLATGKYEAGKYYYAATSDATYPHRLLVAGTDYTVGTSITGQIFVNSDKDETGLIVSKGNSDWNKSFVRQYLNVESVEDFALTHVGDVLPETLPESVFCEGLSEGLKRVIMPITFENEINKILLPSITQMNGVANPPIGEPFEYWVRAMGGAAPTNAIFKQRAIKDAAGNYVFAALIDAQADSHSRRGYIMKSSAGKIGYSYCYNEAYCAPVFYIAVKEAN